MFTISRASFREAIEGERKLLEPLSDEEKNRARYLRGEVRLGEFEWLGPRWGRGFKLYSEVLGRDAWAKVRQVLDKAGWHLATGDESMRRGLKPISDVAKKQGDLGFPGFWKNLVNMGALGGYVEVSSLEEFTAELRKWATGDVLHESPDADGILSEAKFLEDLTEGMRRFVFMAPSVEEANERAITLREFAENSALWAGSGSSKYPERVEYFDDDGKLRRVRRSKWSTALVLSADKVESILRQKKPSALKQYNSAILKRETEKGRAVVNSDDETYLRMAYISLWLETAMKGHPLSTLFMSSRQMYEMWNRLSESVNNLSGVKLPLDQSHFDWQQNKRMINAFLDVLRDFISVNASDRIKQDLLLVLESVRITLVTVTGELRIGDTVIPVEKGIMSGWRWTALIDTVFNFGELFSAVRLCERQGLPVSLQSIVCQGDDDQLETDSYSSAAGIVAAYDIMNFEINPGKFFAARDRDEYLRQVAEGGGVSGYMARAVNSLLWRNPINKDPVGGLLRAREQLTSWNVIIGRGGNVKRTVDHMVRDIAGGNGLSFGQVWELLRTPASVGGLGALKPSPEGNWLAMTEGTFSVRPRIEWSSIHGLDDEKKYWSDRGIELTDKMLYDSVVDKLEFTRVRKEVVAGSVFEVDPVVPILREIDGGGGIPITAPRPKGERKTVVGDIVMREMVRRRDWTRLEEFFVDPSWSWCSKRILQHGGRRVWVDWVLGKLPFSQPVVFGCSGLMVSVQWKEVVKGYWSYVVGRQKFSYKTVLRAAIAAELVARERVLANLTRLGG
jgi:hypothetical protein